MINIGNIGKELRSPELITSLLAIWAASVRASHHFLTEEDISDLCPYAEEAIRQIETLWVVEDENVRIGFMGIQSDKIEMLFLHPDYFRKGIGRLLIQKAFSECEDCTDTRGNRRNGLVSGFVQNRPRRAVEIARPRFC